MKLFDDKYRNDKIKLIAGVDEAGRGPLAGPVVSASVIYEPHIFIEGVNDSKKLNEKTREILFEKITDLSLAYSYQIISPSVIDKINILQATLLAMKKAVDKLKVKPDLILIDGNKIFKTSLSAIAIVKGDEKSFSIASASIIAKVVRDRIMKNLSSDFPEYNWFKNKGYPTSFHIEAIKKFGPTIHHRKTFIRKILSGNQIEIF